MANIIKIGKKNQLLAELDKWNERATILKSFGELTKNEITAKYSNAKPEDMVELALAVSEIAQYLLEHAQ